MKIWKFLTETRIDFFENIGPDYLWRFRLIPRLTVNDQQRYPPCNAFLHVFWKSDHDRALHDHPWHSVSIKLWGTAYEKYWQGSYLGECERTVPNFKPIHRPPEWRHRIILPYGGPVVTLFFVGFKKRSWGFWPNYHTYVPWRKYLNREENANVD